jgi:hypothetical protein
MLRKSFFLVALVVLLLAGCSEPISVEEAEAALCDTLVQFRAAVNALEALTPESTVEEAEAALAVVADAWDDVTSAAYTLSSAQYDQLDEAYEDLDDAIDAIDEADTIQDASAEVQAQVANVNAAYDEFFSVQCVGTE